MQVLLLFVSLAIWCSAAEDDPYYLVTVSEYFAYPSEQKACVVLSHLNCAVNLKLEFVTGDSEVKLLVEDKIDEPEHSQCYSFQVPDPTTYYAFWDFRVSINGDNVNISESKNVYIHKNRPRTFVQTDKPLYKPGQTVNFQVVKLDDNLHVHNETISLVEIKDPNENTIAQWRDVKPVKGITDFSFPLEDEIPLGEYNIIISHATTHTFSVTEYELKNFEVHINIPDAVSGKDDSFPLEVCGRYVFGKPVHGSMQICVCKTFPNPLDVNHRDDRNERSDCQCFENVQIDNKGCFTKDVDLHFYNLTGTTNTYIRQLSISAAIKEHGTGRVEKASKSLQIGSPKLMNFVDVDYYYHKGIAYTGMLNVVDKKRNPKANEKVFIIVNNDDEKTNVSLVTDEKGIAHFSLDTSDWKHGVSIMGAFDMKDDDDDNISYSAAYRWLYPFYSASNSFLKLQKSSEIFSCDADQAVKVEYSISKKDLNPDSHELKIYYLFVSAGNILSSGEHILNVKGETSDPKIHGSFKINIERKQNMYPFVQLVIFTLLKNGAVSGDQALYKISRCFKNKKEIKLEFSEKEVHLRGKVKLNITADPGSMCSVGSVDKGLLLVKSLDQFFYDSTDDAEFGSYSWETRSERVLDTMQDDTQACSGKATDSEDYDNSPEPRVADVSSIFFVTRIKLLTNAKVRKPCPDSELSADQTAPSPSHSRKQKTKKHITRMFLTETWVHDLVSVGDDGHTQLSLTTSDAITNWETSAFCISNTGYGQAQKVHLNTIQPFFTELALPHSVVQGEIFPVTAQVFNYLENCMVVETWLSESEDFKAVRTNKENTYCICTNHSETFTWNVTAKTIGKLNLKVNSAATKLEAGCPEGEADLGNKDIKDSLKKTIIVKPSGVKKNDVKLYRICPEGGSERREVVLKLPDTVVSGSEHAEIAVFGDILSNSVINLERVANSPTGSGDQNIAYFALNLQLFHYFKNSNQLTSEVKAEIQKRLTTGYQKQLRFRNEDGSYNTYPNEKGNIGLTAKVVNAFSQARDLIYINGKDIQGPLKWLSSAQFSSDCFQTDGKNLSYWEESVQHENIRLAALVAIDLMESGAAYENEMLKKAMTCMKNGANRVKYVTAGAVLAYAFTLSGDEELRKHMLEDLEKKAKQTDISTHWEKELRFAGVENIETTAYVALTLLTHQPTSKETGEASKMIHWIASKQDSYGAYLPTPDTILGLQVLSKFAESAVIRKGDVSVSVRSLSGFKKEFLVDKDQGVLLQKDSLPDIPGEYVVTATGGPCVYVQTHLRYHVPVVKNETHFALSVSTRPTVCTYQADMSFEVVVELSYIGTRASSNMVMVEVKLLSGFKANKNSVDKLLQILHVKRTEIKDETVILYLDKVTRDKLSLAFSVTEETHVDNLQPASVLVYDYCKPEHRAVAEYSSPCHKE